MNVFERVRMRGASEESRAEATVWEASLTFQVAR